MKYWRFLSGADAMYARQHEDGRCDYLDDDTLEWVESDELAAVIDRDPTWVPTSAEEVAAARGPAALAS